MPNGRSPSGSLSSRKWASVRREALDRDGWRCTKCGKASTMEVHHIVEVWRGGAPYDLDNLASLCTKCHIEIHARPRTAWHDFRDELRCL